jgi:hypothetical protein
MSYAYKVSKSKLYLFIKRFTNLKNKYKKVIVPMPRKISPTVLYPFIFESEPTIEVMIEIISNNCVCFVIFLFFLINYYYLHDNPQ